MTIAEALKPGSENAITAGELAKMFGTTRRDVFKRVEAERENGAAILACGRGLYLSPSREALREYLTRRYSRLRKEFYTLRRLKAAGEILDGQEYINGG